MSNIFDKEKYVIYYESLQLYLTIGLKPKTLHRVLKFNQLQWLKPYIEFNKQKRIEAKKKNKDKDGEALYKSMNSPIYGKTMENLKNSIYVKLVNNEEDYLKCTAKSSYMSHQIFYNNLVAVRKSKVALKLNKPAYIEMCVLELSKVLMYEFHYYYIKK